MRTKDGCGPPLHRPTTTPTVPKAVIHACTGNISLADLSQFLVLHLERQQGILKQLLGGGALVGAVVQEQLHNLLLKYKSHDHPHTAS